VTRTGGLTGEASDRLRKIMGDTRTQEDDRAESLRATQRFYDRLSRAYDLLADAGEHTVRDRALALLAAAPGERVLELGFGTGHGLEALARAVGEDGAVVGIDLSSGMHEVARKRLERAGLATRVALRREAVPPIQYPDGSFDAMFMSFTLELFPAGTIPTLLAEIRRVLRAGGRLGIAAMNASGQQERPLERVLRFMHRHFPHIVDCQPIDVAGLLHAAGFTQIELHGLSIWSLPVAAAVACSPAAATSRSTQSVAQNTASGEVGSVG